MVENQVDKKIEIWNGNWVHVGIYRDWGELIYRTPCQKDLLVSYDCKSGPNFQGWG